MRIVLLGPPGSGKAELSKRIASDYKLPILTQSSVVDTVAAEQSELGRLAAEARDASRVSDELLLALLRIQLPKMDLSRGYVLVNMPKNAGQAEVLDSVLNDLERSVDLVLNLEVDRDDLMERLVGYIQCDHCGACYNLYVNPPMVDGVCDDCGARVRRRPDDYEETISNRLREYDNQMGPLLQYYNETNKLQRVDAGVEFDALWRRVKPIIEATPGPESAGAEAERSEESLAEAAESVALADQSAELTGKGSRGADSRPDIAESARPKKAAGRKASGKTATAKKAAAKKSSAKKSSAKKSSAKKTAAKKTTAKKTTAKKTTAKKTTAKKTTAKKTAAKKTAAKKTTAKKATAKKATAKKATAKKATAKKAAAKKAAAKKATAKKAAAKKTTSKKAVAKKASSREKSG